MKTRILIVEDRKSLLDLIISYLDNRFKDKIDIFATYDGSTAIKMFEQLNFDLLITDYKMPGLDGLQLMERIRDTEKVARVIFITAYGDDNVQKRVSQMGAVRYLEKPFSMDELGNAIEEIISPNRFQGESKGIDICDFVKLIGLIKGSRLIWVRGNGDNWGKIYFEAGRCVHAETGNKEGKEAFFEIMSWDCGLFKDMPYLPPPKKTIGEELHLLILELFRLKDKKPKES